MDGGLIFLSFIFWLLWGGNREMTFGGLFIIGNRCDSLWLELYIRILDLNFDIHFDLLDDGLVDVDGLFGKEEIFDGVGTVDCEKIAGC